MVKKMDYKKGKIYCIRSYKTDDIYIGSTCSPLNKRFWQHKKNHRRWKEGKKVNGITTSWYIIEHGDAYIELMEEYPCDNKQQLRKREGEYIRENECINKNIPGRTKKECDADYYKKNGNRIRNRRNKYYQENKEEHKEYMSKYYQENKEDISEKGKKRYEKNKDWLRTLITCPCGSIHQYKSKADHKKTKRHQKYLNDPNSKYCRPCI